MLIGVPKEIKVRECRVGLVPVDVLREAGCTQAVIDALLAQGAIKSA